MTKLACGGMAGAIAQTITYPLDVLRRRMQVASMPSSPFRYKGMLDAAYCILINEGPRGFYRGVLPNLLKVVPSISTSFVVYEHSKKLMKQL